MADKISVSNELKLVAKFADNDTRTIPVPNPKDNLTAEQINAAGTTIKNTGVILGDKTGADFLKFDTAKTIKKTTTQLDLR